MISRSNNFLAKILNRRILGFYLSELPRVRLTHSPPGSGAGKGGGAGGSVREAGGALGRYGTAQEEGYFYNKSKEELEKLREKMKKQEAEERKQKKEDDD